MSLDKKAVTFTENQGHDLVMHIGQTDVALQGLHHADTAHVEASMDAIAPIP